MITTPDRRLDNARFGRARFTRAARTRLQPWRERAVRLLWALRINRPESQRPLPRVRIQLTRSVPGWALRLLGLAIAAGCLIAMAPAVPLLVFAGTALLLWLIRPGGLAVAVFMIVVGIAVLVEPDPFAPAGFIATAAVHLLLVLSCLLGPAAWSARFELSVLGPAAVRWVVIQVIAQALGWLGRWIGTLQLTLPVLPILAGVALVGFAVWLWPRLSRPERE